jgi:hypothetical protein
MVKPPVKLVVPLILQGISHVKTSSSMNKYKHCGVLLLPLLLKAPAFPLVFIKIGFAGVFYGDTSILQGGH